MNPELRLEQEALHQRLYKSEEQSTGYTSGAITEGACSIRMCLTWLSHWRGAGALHPTGIWPRASDSVYGMRLELGPPPSEQYPLLTDDQCIRLLNEGCPFLRPSEERARVKLDEIDLDAHDSPARMRTVMLAQLFFEWRESTDTSQKMCPTSGAGLFCRLANTRATMSRLVAGLSSCFEPVRPGEDYAVNYPVGAVPAGGFGPPAAQPAAAPAATAGTAGVANSATNPTLQPGGEAGSGAAGNGGGAGRTTRSKTGRGPG